MKEFIRKWSNFWVFNSKRKQLDDAFEKELNELIEREVALRIHDVVRSCYMGDKTVYFQPPGIRPQYCEAGMISETDPEYIWYYDEPCKILISEVKIIPKEDIIYDKKKRSYLVRSAL